MNEMMLETGRFTTTGVIDEAFYRTSSRHLITAKYKRALAVTVAALMVLGAVLCLAGQTMVGATVLIAAPVTGVLRYSLDRKTLVKQAVARMQETAPDGAITLTTAFTAEGMQVSNEATGGQLTLPYATIQWVRETDAHFILSTKAGQISAVFKDCLADAERQELIGYLRGKGIPVKTI